MFYTHHWKLLLRSVPDLSSTHTHTHHEHECIIHTQRSRFSAQRQPAIIFHRTTAANETTTTTQKLLAFFINIIDFFLTTNNISSCNGRGSRTSKYLSATIREADRREQIAKHPPVGYFPVRRKTPFPFFKRAIYIGRYLIIYKYILLQQYILYEPVGIRRIIQSVGNFFPLLRPWPPIFVCHRAFVIYTYIYIYLPISLLFLILVRKTRDLHFFLFLFTL